MSDTETDITRRFYDRISVAYDLIADAGEHETRERGLAALDVKEGEHVLEIGYGTGHSVLELAGKVGDNGKVCGVDISPGMHDAAMTRLQKAGLADRVDLQVAPVPPIPWPDANFDVVTMSFTLELFPLDQIPIVLAEAKRVLRNDGRIGVVSMSVTPSGQKDSLLEKSYKWMHQHFPHIVDCQPIPAAHLLQEAGFALTHNETLEIWSMPVAVLVGVKQA
jgi:ubiquinone/menaquinone biosynthesis C-methylase UbiE